MWGDNVIINGCFLAYFLNWINLMYVSLEKLLMESQAKNWEMG